MKNVSDKEQAAMRRALALAAKGRGAVEPNPMVGCVLLKRGKVVGQGAHRRFGGAHAEVNALRSAGSLARGATMLVTLEPCTHHGKTPPCTDAIIRAGVRKVLYALRDPNPATGGRARGILQRAGIEVAAGPCAADARKLNAPYIKLTVTGMPYVTAKWAMTLDGKIASRLGDAKWISSARSRRIGHRMPDSAFIGQTLKAFPVITKTGNEKVCLRYKVYKGSEAEGQLQSGFPKFKEIYEGDTYSNQRYEAGLDLWETIPADVMGGAVQGNIIKINVKDSTKDIKDGIAIAMQPFQSSKAGSVVIQLTDANGDGKFLCDGEDTYSISNGPPTDVIIDPRTCKLSNGDQEVKFTQALYTNEGDLQGETLIIEYRIFGPAQGTGNEARMTLVVEAGLPDDNGVCKQMKPIGEQSGGVYRQLFTIYRENKFEGEGTACPVSSTKPLEESCSCGGTDYIDCFAGQFCYLDGHITSCQKEASSKAQQDIINSFGSINVYEGGALSKQDREGELSYVLVNGQTYTFVFNQPSGFTASKFEYVLGNQNPISISVPIVENGKFKLRTNMINGNGLTNVKFRIYKQGEDNYYELSPFYAYFITEDQSGDKCGPSGVEFICEKDGCTPPKTVKSDYTCPDSAPICCG